MTASALKPHSACVTDMAANTWSTRPVPYVFCVSRYSAHATYRAATTWSARPLPYRFSVQTQCTCAHTVQGLCLMGFLSAHAPYRAATTWTARPWVFCPVNIHTTYMAPTTWTARLWVFCPENIHTTSRAATTWSERPVPHGSSVQTRQNQNESCFCQEQSQVILALHTPLPQHTPLKWSQDFFFSSIQNATTLMSLQPFWLAACPQIAQHQHPKIMFC